jgi:hypothetical protein
MSSSSSSSEVFKPTSSFSLTQSTTRSALGVPSSEQRRASQQNIARVDRSAPGCRFHRSTPRAPGAAHCRRPQSEGPANGPPPSLPGSSARSLILEPKSTACKKAELNKNGHVLIINFTRYQVSS